MIATRNVTFWRLPDHTAVQPPEELLKPPRWGHTEECPHWVDWRARKAKLRDCTCGEPCQAPIQWDPRKILFTRYDDCLEAIHRWVTEIAQHDPLAVSNRPGGSYPVHYKEHYRLGSPRYEWRVAEGPVIEIEEGAVVITASLEWRAIGTRRHEAVAVVDGEEHTTYVAVDTPLTDWRDDVEYGSLQGRQWMVAPERHVVQVAPALDDVYVIHDARDDMWWGPGFSGYTHKLLRAGAYARAEAEEEAASHPDILTARPLAGELERWACTKKGSVGEALGLQLSEEDPA